MSFFSGPSWSFSVLASPPHSKDTSLTRKLLNNLLPDNALKLKVLRASPYTSTAPRAPGIPCVGLRPSDCRKSRLKKFVPYFHTSKWVTVPTYLLNAFDWPTMPPGTTLLLPETPGSVALGYQVKLTDVSFTRKNGAGGGAFTEKSAAAAEPATPTTSAII